MQAADVLIDEVTGQAQSMALARVLQQRSTTDFFSIADLVRTCIMPRLIGTLRTTPVLLVVARDQPQHQVSR